MISEKVRQVVRERIAWLKSMAPQWHDHYRKYLDAEREVDELERWLVAEANDMYNAPAKPRQEGE